MKSKKIKKGFITVPYVYLIGHTIHDKITWEQVMILSHINGFQRAGKQYINYYPTLSKMMNMGNEEIQKNIDYLVEIGVLHEKKKEDSPIIEYTISEKYMEV